MYTGRDSSSGHYEEYGERYRVAQGPGAGNAYPDAATDNHQRKKVGGQTPGGMPDCVGE